MCFFHCCLLCFEIGCKSTTFFYNYNEKKCQKILMPIQNVKIQNVKNGVFFANALISS